MDVIVEALSIEIGKVEKSKEGKLTSKSSQEGRVCPVRRYGFG